MTFAAVAAGQLIGWSIAVGIYLLLTREPKPEPRKPRVQVPIVKASP